MSKLRTETIELQVRTLTYFPITAGSSTQNDTHISTEQTSTSKSTGENSYSLLSVRRVALTGVAPINNSTTI